MTNAELTGVSGKTATASDGLLAMAPASTGPVATGTRRAPGWFKRTLMRTVVPEIAFVLLSALRWTWRIRETNRAGYDRILAGGRSPISAFLHGRTFMLLNTFSFPPGHRQFAMCSKSLDGDAMAHVEKRFGFEVLRGSSGRGGLQAIVDMIRAVRGLPGSGAGLAVDGSRGPRGHAQGGIIVLAQRTGGILVPMTVAASAAWILRNTWDRTLIAKPFARVDVVYGDPLDVPEKLTPAEFETLRADLEERLVALQATADKLSGHTDTEPVRVSVI